MTSTLSGTVLLYDGDCGFCSSAARWLERRIGPRDNTGANAQTSITVVPSQWVDVQALGLSRAAVDQEVHLVDISAGPSNRVARNVRTGSDAIADCLIACRNPVYRVAGGLMRARIFRPLAAFGYRVTARYRHRLPGGTPTCRIPR